MSLSRIFLSRMSLSRMTLSRMSIFLGRAWMAR
jgi:hypothetical protein